MTLDGFFKSGGFWGASVGAMVAVGWWWRDRLNARPLTVVVPDIHGVLDLLETAGRELAVGAEVSWVQPGRPLEGQWRLVSAPAAEGPSAAEGRDSDALPPEWRAELSIRTHEGERHAVVVGSTAARFRFALRHAVSPDVHVWAGPQLVRIRATPRVPTPSRPWTAAAHRRWYWRQIAVAFLSALEAGLARRPNRSS